MAGWPRGSRGSASPPAVGADGTVYYVSELGNVYLLVGDYDYESDATSELYEPGGGS